LIFAASYVLADSNLGLVGDLRSVIQTALKEVAKTEAITCPPNGNTLFCPQSSVPFVPFPPTGGRASGEVDPCCPNQYLQCQVQQNVQYCRNIVEYNISTTSGNNQDVCPPVTKAECQCQKSLSGSKSLFLNFCPTPGDCCPNCSCYGDPHCVAFGGQRELWAQCDARDANCQFSQAVCNTKTYTYQGVSTKCQWTNNQCVVPAGTAGNPPTMIMYSKIYNNYFNPSDPKQYEFSLKLTLTTYGAIEQIEVKDTAKGTYYFKNICQFDPAYPPTSHNQVIISNLPSGVVMTFTCVGGKSPRWDVKSLEDPWYVEDKPNFGGFCATGVIVEREDSQTSLCQTSDATITTAVGTKKSWCASNFRKLIGIYSNQANPRASECEAYVNGGKWIDALCTIASGPSPADPRLCDSIAACRTCKDNVNDYGSSVEDLKQIIAPFPIPPPLGNPAPCPDLLKNGLATPKLNDGQSGIQIDYFNGASWTPVWSATNVAINACGGCAYTMFVNGTVSSNAALTNPGRYRIKQCVGTYNPSNPQDLCKASVGYNATVTYANPIPSGQVVSIPLGELYNTKDMVCNAKKYPKCPPEYACCNWSKQTAYPGWVACMVSNYGPNYATKYPGC